MLKCSICGEDRVPISNSNFSQVPFVCQYCRCGDCEIVLNFECDCGMCHGRPSREEPGVCIECVAIRKSVATIAPELLALRNEQFESVEEPLC